MSAPPKAGWSTQALPLMSRMSRASQPRASISSAGWWGEESAEVAGSGPAGRGGGGTSCTRASRRIEPQAACRPPGRGVISSAAPARERVACARAAPWHHSSPDTDSCAELGWAAWRRCFAPSRGRRGRDPRAGGEEDAPHARPRPHRGGDVCRGGPPRGAVAHPNVVQVYELQRPTTTTSSRWSWSTVRPRHALARRRRTVARGASSRRSCWRASRTCTPWPTPRPARARAPRSRRRTTSCSGATGGGQARGLWHRRRPPPASVGRRGRPASA